MTSSPPITTVNIRSMRSEDMEQVLSIDRLSFSMPWPASAYRYELNENPNSLLWVAEAIDGDQRWVVGMIVVWLILDEAHIATFAVHPDYRGRGIGQRLLTTAMQESIRRGLSKATLEVRAQNVAAQNLYRLFRFELVGHRPRYYRDNNEDALIMTVSELGEDYLKWLDNGGWPKAENKNS